MNASLKGFLSESAVARELIARDFEVYKPLVDVYGSDFIICKNGQFYKIQVRSASEYKPDLYIFSCRQKSGNKYQSDMIDFFIFHLADIDIFYIIPINDVDVTNISLSNNKIGKYSIYRDAWSLLEE